MADAHARSHDPVHAGAVAVRRLSAAELQTRADAFADLLVGCVDGGASVGFMAPLARATALRFWRGIADGLARRERVLLAAEDASAALLGTVQLVFAAPENQPHRAEVAKLLVDARSRRRGIATRLMAAVDTLAREEGRSVLVLDTATGSAAERLYERAGWQRVGVVPRYALMPYGGFCSTTFFHKQL